MKQTGTTYHRQIYSIKLFYSHNVGIKLTVLKLHVMGLNYNKLNNHIMKRFTDMTMRSLLNDINGKLMSIPLNCSIKMTSRSKTTKKKKKKNLKIFDKTVMVIPK